MLERREALRDGPDDGDDPGGHVAVGAVRFLFMILAVLGGIWLMVGGRQHGASHSHSGQLETGRFPLVFDTATAGAIRAGDVDRHAVADELATHLSAGRLSLNEFDERLRRAYAAATLGELRALLDDLRSFLAR